MYTFIKRVIKHPLISGSSIIFLGSFAANLINYLFNLAMGRFLSVNDYGILISLTALIMLIMLIQTSLTTLFAKFAATYTARKDPYSESSLLISGTKIVLIVGVCFFAVLMLLSYPISQFLHINNFLLVSIMFFAVTLSILYSLPAGILQGNLHFIYISACNIVGALGKLFIGIFLVVMGFGLIGAAIGILFSFLISLVMSAAFVFKKYYIPTKKEVKVHFIPEFKKISGPFLMATIAITILQGTDVIFARHFLSSSQAGQYAALSLMGKAIFYITSPLYFVFFPVIAHKKERNETTTGTLFLASGIVFLVSLFFVLIYFLFPTLVLRIFFPAPSYSVLSQFLGLYAVYIMIFSFCFLLFNYFLSTGRVGVYKINWFVAILYMGLLVFFHSTILDFIYVLIFSSLLLLCMLIYYYKKQ